ncbi:MAG: RidA family protein [Acidimicrobiales bacterium]
MSDTKQQVFSGSPYESTYGFSRATRVGDRILAAGTAPIWSDGTCPDDAATQAARCFEIILEAIGELGATAADVVRTRMFLTDSADADAVGRVHGDLFAEARPVATMVVVAGLLRPEWRVEIEAEAIVHGGRS